MENEPLNDDVKTMMREKQTELINLITALDKLQESKAWGTVKEMVFEKSLKAIERQIIITALTPKIDTDKLYRLQGEWAWSKQYADTDRFIDTLKKQLQEIKNKLE